MAEKKTIWLVMSVVGNMGLAVAVPLIIFGLLGRYLDNHFNTSPWLLLVGIFLSLIVTSVTLAKKIAKLLKEVEMINQKEQSSRDKK